MTLGPVILLAARIGYAARGFVYVSVGGLALAAAVGEGQSARGALGAMVALAQMTAGEWWLILVGAGLGCFAFWRALQAGLDADRQGRSVKACVNRIGQAVSGLIYGAMSVSVLEITDALEDVGEADEQQQTTELAAAILALPLGAGMLVLIGLFVAVTGAANIAHALAWRFRTDLDCSERLRRWAGPIGRIGYGARGVAFALTGAYLIRAGWDARSIEAKGLGAALQSLEERPAGPLLLFLVAAGLIAFGLFGLLEARYRFLRLPKMPGASD